jgi:hypothetical protein
MISKELQSEIRRYSAHIAYEIRSKQKRDAVKREYAEHLEDAVYDRMIRLGLDEREAFKEACAELGNVAKMQELLALTHNKDPLPTGVTFMLWLLGAVLVGSSYFWIENESFRAWFIVLLQLSIFALGIVFLLRGRLYVRALFIRWRAYRQLKRYADSNGMHFFRRANSYRSIFTRTTEPEWVLETENERYIMSLFATVRRRRTLRITDAEFFEYEKNFGFSLASFSHTFQYMNFATSKNGVATQNFFFAQSGLSTLSQGKHLFPFIDWERAEHSTKKNVRVLLLNPIPFNLYLVEKGHARESGSNDDLGGLRMWSATSLIEHLETERLLGKNERGKCSCA